MEQLSDVRVTNPIGRSEEDFDKVVIGNRGCQIRRVSTQQIEFKACC